MYVGLVHKHSFEAGIRVATRQNLLIELKNFMQVRHGMFEQWEQLWQAEMGHLRGKMTKDYINHLLWNILKCNRDKSKKNVQTERPKDICITQLFKVSSLERMSTAVIQCLYCSV